MGGPADVAVVIPTRDRAGLLAEAVASVLAQTGPGVEVVVVDDGSRDGTAAWLAEHPDPRVRTIRFEEGQERTRARNAGLAASQTPYVLFLDDDDLLAPEALHRLVAGLERHPAAPVAAGTYATFGTYGPEEVPRQQPIGRFALRHRMWREILWGWYLLPGAGLWRADALRALGGWDETRSFAEDLELSLRVHPRPMALVPHVVLRYRQHGRPVDRAAEAAHERMNDEVRRAFAQALPAREARAARRVLEARPDFARGLRAYGDGEYSAAVGGLGRGLLRTPSLAVSPVLGPTILGMLGKAMLAHLTPPGWRRRVRDSRRAQRAERFGTEAKPS